MSTNVTGHFEMLSDGSGNVNGDFGRFGDRKAWIGVADDTSPRSVIAVGHEFNREARRARAQGPSHVAGGLKTSFTALPNRIRLGGGARCRTRDPYYGVIRNGTGGHKRQLAIHCGAGNGFRLAVILTGGHGSRR